MITKESRIPLHIQMADEIRAQIRRGELHPNDRLPSERELCARYAISRITVRKALGTLNQEGLIQATIGKGNFVAPSALDEELQPLSSFTQDLERRGMQAGSVTQEEGIVSADDGMAEKLGIPRGAEVVSLRRLRLADGRPIAIQLTHLPHHLCPNLLRFNFAERSLYDVLQGEYGLVLARFNTEIMAALASQEEAALLKIRRPAPVLISEQTTYLENNIAIEFTHSVFNAERYKLHTHSR
jgi:GntR family transcriptional regulator